MIRCVYQLKFPNGKSYIGVAKNFSKRWKAHLHATAKGIQLPVHCAIRKYGADNVTRTMLLLGSHEYCLMMEEKTIAHFRTLAPLGYNATLGGERAPTETPEIAARVGASQKGKPKTAEHRAKVSAALKGKPLSSERKEQMRLGHLGKPLSSSHREAISRGNKGRIFSPEQRARITAAHVGAKRSAEIKAKMSTAQIKRFSDPIQRMLRGDQSRLVWKKKLAAKPIKKKRWSQETITKLQTKAKARAATEKGSAQIKACAAASVKARAARKAAA